MELTDTILHGDALETLRTLPDECVQAVITSPPYWGLRDYGVPGQLGLERTPDEYVARMVELFAEVRRVLRADGTCWVNLGDTFYHDSPVRTTSEQRFSRETADKRTRRSCRREGGLKPKDLIGIPWTVAFALRADGWYLRSDIIWAKSNPMPESVTDRPTKTHEYIFLLTKRERYYYDTEAIREGVTGGSHPRAAGRNSRKYVDRDPAHLRPGVTPKSARPGSGIKANSSFHAATTQLVTSRNKRSVWTVATAPFAEAHFATFPPALIEPCILAGTSPKACEHCGAPWAREVLRESSAQQTRGSTPSTRRAISGPQRGSITSISYTHGWRPTCRCEHNTGTGHSLVLDPFMGAGTVGVVARRHSRHYLGIELNASYIEMAERRIKNERQPHLWTA